MFFTGTTPDVRRFLKNRSVEIMMILFKNLKFGKVSAKIVIV